MITRQTEEIQLSEDSAGAIPEEADYLRERERIIDEILDTLSLDAKLAQLIVVEVPPSIAASPSSVRSALQRRYGRADFGGVILFERAILSAGQVRSLTKALSTTSGIPPMIMVDEEGGAVSRVANADIGATGIPSPRVVGLIDDSARAEILGRIVGTELRALGITMNLAPVADVSPFGNDRSYGNDPTMVARHVSAFIRGMQDQHVSAVAKHFPGIGSVRGDTHLGPVSFPGGPEQLEGDVVPFREAIEGGVDAIMISHVAYTTVCDDVPAGFSRCIVGDLLRDRLGFDGLVITDALNMKAVADHNDVAMRAIAAGGDLVLMPPDPLMEIESLRRAVGEGELSEGRIDQSVRRILRNKIDRFVWTPQSSVIARRRQQWEVPSADIVVGSTEHRRLVEELFES